MKISFSTASFYHLPLGFAAHQARALGFDGVEVVAGPDTLLRGERRTQALFAKLGVKPLSFHPPLFPMPGWPRTHPQSVIKTVEMARKLGCELAVIHTTDAFVEGNPRWRAYAQALKSALAAPGQPLIVGVELAQKTVRKRPLAMDDLAAVLRFVEDQGEQVGITLDTAHTGANGEDLLDLYGRVRSRLRNIHLSDWIIRRGKPRTHLVPGEGALDLPAFLRTLAQDGYSGLVTLEISPYHLHAWSVRQGRERLAQSLAYLREQMQPIESGQRT